MRDRRSSRASLTARIEKLADYITRRLTKMDVLVGINQLLCDMARSNKRQSYTELETPDGLLRLSAEERPQASPRPDMKYYELTVTLPDGTSTSGYAVMRKIHPRLDIWELAEAQILNVRHPGSGVDIAPCIAGPPEPCPISAWWLFPLLFFVIWPSLLTPNFVTSFVNIYFTILGLAVVKGVVCGSIGGAVKLGLGGLVASALLPSIYGALAIFAHAVPAPSPPIFTAPMSPDAAWTAYILALVLVYGPSAYLRIREL
jgi:hypothetical protein